MAASEYREVVSIASNTSLTVRNAFTRTFSGQYHYKQTIPIDFAQDAILAEVTRTGNNWTAIFFVSQRGALGAQERRAPWGQQDL